jgi:hypothetical protein
MKTSVAKIRFTSKLSTAHWLGSCPSNCCPSGPELARMGHYCMLEYMHTCEMIGVDANVVHERQQIEMLL